MKSKEVKKFSPLVQWLGSYGLFGAALFSLVPVLVFSVSAWYFIVPLLAAGIWQQIFWNRI